MKQFNQVVVLGGSGFVGSAIVAKLDAAGYQVTVLTRRRELAKHLFLLPNVKVIACDVFNQQALKTALLPAHIVINLIGILHQTRRVTFDKVHHLFPKNVASLCAELGIKRLIHMSSLGADLNAPSLYLQSKAKGETALLAFNQVIHMTTFQPSIIFGRHDKFVNLFAKLIQFLPLIFLVKPNAKFQPVWVEDVASAVVRSIFETQTYGNTYALVGPTVYSFRSLLEKIMQTVGVTRPIIGLNDTLSYAQAFLMELLPVKLMSRDNIRSMEVDSVSATPFPEIFGVTPSRLESIMPDYLIEQNPRGTYDAFRSAAGRAINARR